MKPIDIEKIYPTSEKIHDQHLIDIFFDRHRKLKRHADGTKLINEFVKPIVEREKTKNKELSERKQRGVERSYERCDYNQFTISYQQPEEDKLPHIFSIKEYKEAEKQYLNSAIKDPSYQHLNYESQKSMGTINEKPLEQSQVMNILNSINEDYLESQYFVPISDSLNQTVVPQQFEKDYTRISIIKQRQQNKDLWRNYRNRSIVEKQMMNSSLMQFQSRATRTKHKFNEDIRIIAPFIDSHLSNKNNYHRPKPFNKSTSVNKSKLFSQQWSDFQNSTQHFSNFLQQRKFDQKNLTPFKTVSLRKDL